MISLNKTYLLGSMLSNKPMLKLTKMTCQYEPNIGQYCAQVTLLYDACGKKNDLYNLSSSNAYNDTFTYKSGDGEAILIWSKIQHEWFKNDAKLESFKTVVCGNWYQNTLPGLDFGLWFLINCAPQIILSILVLSLSENTNQVWSLLAFPQLFLSPVFCNIGFKKNTSGKINLSRCLTWANLVLFILEYCLSLWMISDQLQVFPQHLESVFTTSLFVSQLFSAIWLNIVFLHQPYLQHAIGEDFTEIEGHGSQSEELSEKEDIGSIWLAWAMVLFPVIFFTLHLLIAYMGNFVWCYV